MNNALTAILIATTTIVASSCSVAPPVAPPAAPVASHGSMPNAPGFIDAPSRTAPMPTNNPLKGFFAYAGEDDASFPMSMEYFYIGMADIVTAENTYDWTLLDKRLDEIAARGHHAVFRVAIDQPRADSSSSEPEPGGLPRYLTVGCGTSCVSETAYEDKDEANAAERERGKTPDYSNPRLVAAMLGLIDAMDAKLDGDPRVAFIQAGLLGHWGEWHLALADKELPSATQSAVLARFDERFKETKVAVSVDYLDHAHPPGAFKGIPVGFHEDDFGKSTLGPDEKYDFVAQLKRYDLVQHWKKHTIGGEVQPSIQEEVITAEMEKPFIAAIEQTHVSWLLYHELWGKHLAQSPEANARARRYVDLMGYRLRATSYRSRWDGDDLVVDIKVRNSGLAPFPYDWPVELRLDGENATPVQVDLHLSTLLPSTEVLTSTRIVGPRRKSGRLLVRVQNPLAARSRAALPVVLDNEETPDHWAVLGDIQK